MKSVGTYWAEVVRDLLRLTVMMFRMLLMMSSVVLTVLKIKVSRIRINCVYEFL